MFLKNIVVALTLLIVGGTQVATAAEDSAWTSIINGKDLTGWTPYFQKTGLKNTDSTFKFSPEGYFFVDIKTSFNVTGFGHCFYTKRKLSYYMVRSSYRFPTATYGPDWKLGGNMQNNGLMLHSQDPTTMKGKDFPTSIEVQLLGPANEQNADQKALGFKYATTANVCTPFSFISWNGIVNYTQHCTAAQYPSIWKNTEIPWEDKDGWSDVTVRVLSDSLVQHYIHSVKVFEYTHIREDDGTPMKSGYLSVQCEGTSTQFKTLEILDLVGCMDKTNTSYRSYFVKSDPATCTGTTAIILPPVASSDLIREGNLLRVRGTGARIIGVRKSNGSLAQGFSNSGAGVRGFALREPGLYFVTLGNTGGSSTVKVPFF